MGMVKLYLGKWYGKIKERDYEHKTGGITMAVQVYTFHITYEGLAEKIWRKAEVSSNYRLDRLGYMVLAAFDTMAYHLFEFYYKGRRFDLPGIDAPRDCVDMGQFKLGELGLQIGDRIQMDYDFGTTQTFWLELIDVADMQRGRGSHYPYIVDGAGCGIIDDMDAENLAELIDQIDRNGKTDEPVYYNERRLPWDYRWFDLDCINSLLKGEVQMIEEGYAPFWEE